MPLFPDVDFPSDVSVLPRLPTDAEWAAAVTASAAAEVAYVIAGSPAGEEPRVERFLPIDAGGQGLVWPPTSETVWGYPLRYMPRAGATIAERAYCAFVCRTKVRFVEECRGGPRKMVVLFPAPLAWPQVETRRGAHSLWAGTPEGREATASWEIWTSVEEAVRGAHV